MPAVARAAVAAVAVCVLAWGVWLTVRAGASRMISEYALAARVPEAASIALSLTPSDPEASYALAVLLADRGDAAGAVRLYERAVSLRPRDYLLWVGLGESRDAEGDAEGAAAAFREAVRLAPSYAAPRWQLGNTLLRAGLRNEALTELRRATESDPSLYPKLIQTAWYGTGKDARQFVQAAGPRTPDETLAVARFLIKEGETDEGLKLLRGSGAQLTEESRKTLVADLIAAERFADAYRVWSEGRGAIGSLTDGGFEEEARSDEWGFGWRFARDVQNVKLSLDADAPREGARSLKVEYAGNSEPAQPALSRLVAVEPGAHYRLTFSARTKELVTGGPPFVEIVSAAKLGEALATAALLPTASTTWQEFALEFNAPAAGAVRVALRRQPCASSPCPAFGAVWLDAFGLRRVERKL
jgi:tetratricopeptide (TPR) repeat protein